jgi:hypothetical protein
MFIGSAVHHRFVLNTWLKIFIIAVTLIGQAVVPPASPVVAAPSFGVLETLGDFLSLGANTMRELQEAIPLMGVEMRATLRQLYGDINSLMQTLNQMYQDNLNISINSLDAVTRSKIYELEGLIDKVNQALQEDIILASDEAQKVVRDAAQKIQDTVRDLELSLKEVIIYGGETAAYIIDRATSNVLAVISVLMLGLGILLFIWLLYVKRKSPGVTRTVAFILMAAYTALFVSIAFVPPVRAWIMVYTGLGLRGRVEKVASAPRIIDVVPYDVVLGQTREVQVWGTTLMPQGKTPSVKIADHSLPVTSSSDQLIALDVSGLTGPTGTTFLVMTYEGIQGPDPERLNLKGQSSPPVSPPDLIIASFTISPAHPLLKKNAQATIVVRNDGNSAAGKFIVAWRPSADQTAQTSEVKDLDAGESQPVVFNYAYMSTGSFDTVAIVDYLNWVDESKEDNNNVTQNVEVRLEIQPGSTSHPVTPPSTCEEEDPCPPPEGKEMISRCCPDANGCCICVPKNLSCPK